MIRCSRRVVFIALALCVSSRIAANKSITAPKGRADRIVVEKAARKMTIYQAGRAIGSYKIALGRHPTGAKEREGDNRTPEGIYRIDFRNAGSAYHRSLHVSYPNPSDQARGKAGGYNPGGAIMIHGLPKKWAWLGSFHRLRDWTRGCIAVTNAEMDEIWGMVPDGTIIEIRP